MRQQTIFEDWNVQLPSRLFGLRIKNSAVHLPQGVTAQERLCHWTTHLLSSQDWEIHCMNYSFDLSRSVTTTQKGNTKGYSRTPRITLQCTMAHLQYIAYRLHIKVTQWVTQGRQESLFSIPWPIANTLHTDCYKVRTFMYPTKTVFFLLGHNNRRWIFWPLNRSSSFSFIFLINYILWDIILYESQKLVN